MYITSTVLESPPFGAPLPSPTAQPCTCHSRRSPTVQGAPPAAGSSGPMSAAAREVTAEPLSPAACGPSGGATAATATEPAAVSGGGSRGSELLRHASEEGSDILNKLSRTCRSRYQCPPLSPSFISQAKAVLLLRTTKAGQWCCVVFALNWGRCKTGLSSHV